MHVHAEQLDACLRRDATLAADIEYGARECATRSDTALAFLTGATGFLGANLLRDLLACTPGDVRCLVRARTVADAMARLRRSLSVQGLWRDGFEARIHPVLGDLSSPLFGLSKTEFAAAGRNVGVFYHAAARVNLLLPYQSLRSTNIMGTHEVLRLASRGHAAAFHHVSSISAYRTHPVRLQPGSAESAPIRIGRGVSSYAVTKWVAEQLVNAASERGLPVSIWRPGTIAAHSTTAAYNDRDVFALVVTACMRLRVAPACEAAVHLTPVDVVSRAIVESSLGPRAGRQVFHLVNPAAVQWADVVHALRQSGKVTDCEPYTEWRQRLHREARAHGERDLRMLDLLASDSRLPLPKTRLEFAVATAEAAHSSFRAASYPDPRVLVDRYIRRISVEQATRQRNIVGIDS